MKIVATIFLIIKFCKNNNIQSRMKQKEKQMLFKINLDISFQQIKITFKNIKQFYKTFKIKKHYIDYLIKF